MKYNCPPLAPFYYYVTYKAIMLSHLNPSTPILSLIFFFDKQTENLLKSAGERERATYVYKIYSYP